jgi:quercetin dioxygenase-like cupin family protein
VKIQARSTVHIDNERARVTEWRLAPMATTGYHRHEFDYVVVPLTSGRMQLISPEGSKTTTEMTLGKPYFRSAGVEHETINANDYEFVFMEIEIK